MITQTSFLESIIQDKMLLFNKPKVNEKEMMIQQRKKASFNSKCAKFEGINEPVLVKKESLTKVYTKFSQTIFYNHQLILDKGKVVRKP